MPVAAILLLGLALRLHGLVFQSLWYDELYSVVFSHPDLSLASIVETTATRDVHPLGYPLLLHFWMAAFGATDFVARLLSALAGTTSIAVMYLLGKAIHDRATGLVAAALTAANAFHLHYSQEARSYALLFLAAALSYLALVALLERASWPGVVVYAAVAACAIHLHYFGVMLVGAQLLTAAIFAMIRARRALPTPRPRAPHSQPSRYPQLAEAAPFFAAGALVAVAALPWLVPLLRAASMDEYWPPLPGPAFAAEYFHLYFGESPGLTALFAGLLLLAPFVIPRKRASRSSIGRIAPGTAKPSPREIAALFGAIILLSLLVPYLWSRFLVPMMQARFSMIFLPALLAIVALVVASLPRAVRAGIATLALVGSLAHLVAGGYYTTVRNEQWREAARWAAAEASLRQGEDRFVSELAPGFQFYFDQDGVASRILPAHLPALERSYRALRGGGGLWLLVARDRRGSVEFTAELERLFRKVDERRFHGAAAEHWVARAWRRPREPAAKDRDPGTRAGP